MDADTYDEVPWLFNRIQREERDARNLCNAILAWEPDMAADDDVRALIYAVDIARNAEARELWNRLTDRFRFDVLPRVDDGPETAATFQNPERFKRWVAQTRDHWVLGSTRRIYDEWQIENTRQRVERERRDIEEQMEEERRSSQRTTISGAPQRVPVPPTPPMGPAIRVRDFSSQSTQQQTHNE